MTDENSGLPVAVDAAGGDNGVEIRVEGAVQALKEFGCSSVLVGDCEQLNSALNALGASNLGITVCHASENIGMDESPTRAVRRKPDSSICVAYNLVESGRASSVMSAGNSGAMMAAGRFKCGLLPGIERPAIATVMPVVGDGMPYVILDTGANVDCHAHNLVQFAIMGSIYFGSLFDVERPKIGLLSNGEESSKGTDVTRAAALVLSQIDSVNYVGYVEGRDLGSEKANVIVCDGFVGNIVLKALEGCVRFVGEQLKLEAESGLLRRVSMGLAKNVIRDVFKERFDYTSYGGCPLLGLRKLALVLHGSSDARAVKNAIKIADSFAKNKMNEAIAREISRFEEKAMELDDKILASVLGKGRGARNNNNNNVKSETLEEKPEDSAEEKPPSIEENS